MTEYNVKYNAVVSMPHYCDCRLCSEPHEMKRVTIKTQDRLSLDDPNEFDIKEYLEGVFDMMVHDVVYCEISPVPESTLMEEAGYAPLFDLSGLEAVSND